MDTSSPLAIPLMADDATTGRQRKRGDIARQTARHETNSLLFSFVLSMKTAHITVLYNTPIICVVYYYCNIMTYVLRRNTVITLKKPETETKANRKRKQMELF